MASVHGNSIDLGHAVGGVGGDGGGRRRRRITLSPEQRSRHLLAVGATGSGKSRFLESLIRQDILAWPRSRCGLLLIDPHGEVFDRVMAWAAANDLLRRWPIVPIDLRRSDWVVSYNPLRPRGGSGDPAVVVGGFMRSMLYAWGQSSSSETPRLAKWLRTLLSTLYAGGFTLAEVRQLIADPAFRRAAASRVEDAASRMVWGAAGQMKEAEFQEQVESTVNRVMKFLATQVMRATLCQSGPSLDLGQVLEAGSIVLVSLATEGTQLDEEDADTFGSVLLTDLWTAAKARGKREGLRSFYVYADEFQHFVTPTMARTLNEARGFGLHFNLAHQYPSQILHRGGVGVEVYDAVMASTRTKVVFQMDHPADLPVLAQWLYRADFDPDDVKHQHYATKVLGHQMTMVPSYGTSQSRTEGGGRRRGYGSSSGTGGTAGRSTSRTATDAAIEGDAPVETSGEGASESDSWQSSLSESYDESESWADAKTSTTNWTTMSIPVFGREASPPQFRTVEEQLFRATQFLAGQPQRHAVVRVDNGGPEPMVTQTVGDVPITAAYVAEALVRRLQATGLAVPMHEALRQMRDREIGLLDVVLPPDGGQQDLDAEPATTRRKVDARPVPATGAAARRPRRV